jgi:MYXO-CTERM domain-containing protein
MTRKLLVAMVLACTTTAFAGPLRREVKVVQRPVTSAPETIPKTIFLNRCKGGCTIKFGTIDDATSHTSQIPMGGTTFTMSEFAWGDTEWNQLLTCFKEVYSPYGVTVTDVQPPASVDYNEGIVAGTPAELGLPDDFGGIAPITGTCSPVDHAISFSFANIYTTVEGRVHEICWTAAQEVGHTFGLDHEYEFTDGTSACRDPMTYRDDCGGEKFFRDIAAKCGEYGPRDCRCSAFQTSHKLLQAYLGAGTPITTATVSITTPAEGGTIANGAAIHATASAQRGVERVEFRLNGYPWSTLPGAAFGPTGQPATDYSYVLPADVPDGVIDIEIVAIDDLGITGSQKVTVTKGAPCVSADTCAEGQKCEAGRCFWDPPAGETGDSCEYDQFCTSGRCGTIGGDSFCTQTCNASLNNCPDGFDCLANGGENICWPPDSGGCCSSSRGEPPWLAFLGAGVVFGLVMRRRRR